MRTRIILALIFATASLPIAMNWTEFFQDFFTGQSKKATKFFEKQRHKIKHAVNSYVETVKESGRKVADFWSYLPSEDSGARMENPDMVLSVPAIISKNGYTCEIHTIVSQGYILNVHRIPRSKNTDDVPSKTVLLHHGMFASSIDWILNGPEKSLAYALADTGYDVWMPNIRGNKYSREHAWLKTNTKSYWNFSWHDVALHDVPAIIDYIMNVKTDSNKITYLGHSMGTTILFAMLTLRPEYNNILKAGFALAPVVYMAEVKSSLKFFAPIASNVAYMEMLYGSHEFIPKHSTLGRIIASCKPDSYNSFYCRHIMFSICGSDVKQFNKDLLPMFLSHLGHGTSWKTILHFAQLITSQRFQQFDYGSNNKRVYGSELPPEYDLSKVTLPITMFWAKNDSLSSETAVNMLKAKLPASTETYLIPFPEFNHLDYLWAIDAPTLLNEKVIEKLNETNEYDFFFSINMSKID